MTYAHCIAVQIFYLMTEAFVIFKPVASASRNWCEFKECIDVEFFAFERFEFIESLFEAVFSVEKSRLVHVVPESFYARIGESLVFAPEPFSCIIAEKISENAFSRPDCSDKIASVCFFAEIIAFFAFFVNFVAFFLLDSCINNRNQMDSFS